MEKVIKGMEFSPLLEGRISEDTNWSLKIRHNVMFLYQTRWAAPRGTRRLSRSPGHSPAPAGRSCSISAFPGPRSPRRCLVLGRTARTTPSGTGPTTGGSGLEPWGCPRGSSSSSGRRTRGSGGSIFSWEVKPVCAGAAGSLYSCARPSFRSPSASETEMLEGPSQLSPPRTRAVGHAHWATTDTPTVLNCEEDTPSSATSGVNNAVRPAHWIKLTWRHAFWRQPSSFCVWAAIFLVDLFSQYNILVLWDTFCS